MKTLYLDCFAGVSGDMFIGALLDCGLDFNYLKAELARLGVTGYELSLSRLDQSGISAAKFDVHLLSSADHQHSHEHSHSHDHEHSHSHDHSHLSDSHEHSHSHSHSHSHDHPHHSHNHEHQHSHDHAHSPESGHSHQHSHDHAHSSESGHRSLTEIKRLIAVSNLSLQVKQRATEIFERIGQAESRIHNIPLESVHFHEVGAIDSIVDVVGACIGLEALGIGQIISSPLHVGAGTFECAHGRYPVPGPAATELLKGVPIYSTDIQGELVTPTGAAIVATLAARYGQMPLMRIEKTGYGAGTRLYPRFPNVLRAVIGELETETASPDNTPTVITIIEATIDDLNGQVFGHLMQRVLDSGALDIFYTSVQMKKNRPGTLLTVLCRNADRQKIIDLIFRETTTLGVRWREERREILRREHVTVKTPFGAIRIKTARNDAGEIVSHTPEFDDCLAAAEKQHRAVREVQAAALAAWSQMQTASENR
jgi:hypothetical protein